MGVEESYEKERRYFYDAANNDYQLHTSYVDPYGNVRINVTHYGAVPPSAFPRSSVVYAYFFPAPTHSLRGNYPAYMSRGKNNTPHQTIRTIPTNFQLPGTYQIPSSAPEYYQTMYSSQIITSPNTTFGQEQSLLTLKSRPISPPTGTQSPYLTSLAPSPQPIIATSVSLPVQPLPPVYTLAQIQADPPPQHTNLGKSGISSTGIPYRSANAHQSYTDPPSYSTQPPSYPQYAPPLVTNPSLAEPPRHAVPVIISEQIQLGTTQTGKNKTEYQKQEEERLKERERLQRMYNEQFTKQLNKANRLEAQRIQDEKMEKALWAKPTAQIEKKVEEPFILERAPTITNQIPKSVPVPKPETTVTADKRFNPLPFGTPEVKGFDAHDDL